MPLSGKIGDEVQKRSTKIAGMSPVHPVNFSGVLLRLLALPRSGANPVDCPAAAVGYRWPVERTSASLVMNQLPTDLHSELEDRLRFEMLMTELSARFVSATA